MLLKLDCKTRIQDPLREAPCSSSRIVPLLKSLQHSGTAIPAFGLMLATKPALPHQFGNSLTAQHQPRVHASSNPPLDSIRLKKPLALLMLIQQPALLIRIAFTGQLNASKEFSGSRSSIYIVTLVTGFPEEINWLVP